MARPALYRQPRRVNILIETEVHRKAARKAFRMGLRGGFSEYVSRLIAADRRRKNAVEAAS